MKSDHGRVRLWQRALVERYEEAGLESPSDEDFGAHEAHAQEIFAEVGMILAQLQQVEHGLNEVLRASMSSDEKQEYRHSEFGPALKQTKALVEHRCPPGLLERPLDVLAQARSLRNHLTHGELSVGWAHPEFETGGKDSVIVIELWEDGDDTKELEVVKSRRLAEDALDAVVAIMMGLGFP